MFDRTKSGGQIIGESIAAFVKYPQLIVPLLFSWIFYAGTILYLKFSFNWAGLPPATTFLLCFGVIFALSSMLCFSASWLLEMVEQIETGKPLDVLAALNSTLSRNLLPMLPIALSWATIWFALLVINALTSKRNSVSEKDKEFNFKNATNLLAGTNQKASWTKQSLNMLEKLVRMLVFLSLPAVCWRKMGGISAMGEGLRTARTHSSEFFTGYVLSGAAAAILFLPVALPAYLDQKDIIQIPAEAWPAMFVYLAFAWSFSIYIEQMFSAELYLWHMNWEKAVKHAKENGLIEPKLFEVRRPSIVDDSLDLTEFQSKRTVKMERAYVARQTKELIKANASTQFFCSGCSHEFEVTSFKELALYDYDLDSVNGVQLKCPSCSTITTYDILKRRA